MRIRSFTLLAASFLLIGCATKTETGALIGGGGGAAIGAGIGAAIGGGEGALIGAGAGAVAGGITGGLIGRYMDRQEERLRQQVRSAKIVRKGDQLVVQFQSGILFDVDKYDLRPASQTQLTDFAQVLKEFPDTDLVVKGHTDNTGSASYNEKLSSERARSVSEFLGGKGVASSRLTAIGYGEDRPVASNATTEGRQENRRVEIQITPDAKLRKEAAKR